ncbi:MAG: hypothetical protein M1835_008133 [Candelina submexicana]|nr:MAG: hypothetical protein M1835_008133 [Candelina submexicana]
MSTPTLINLPPPPSDPVTPSDMGPGTPNSGTTSMSALSTTAIKDGHQGHAPAHPHFYSSSSRISSNTLDAERADRISRLAGLERVAAIRQGGGPSSLTPGTAINPPPGYFDSVNPQQRERSTVGSASATGSAGDRTTSDMYDADKMSEDQDDGVSSTGGFSDEGNASLVGFGETASSTVSGPISNAGSRAQGRHSGLDSPTVGKASALPGYLQQQQGSPMTGVSSPASSTTTNTTASAIEQRREAKRIDGMTYDLGVVDTVASTPPPANARNTTDRGAEATEAIMSDRFEDRDQGRRATGTSEEQGDGGKGQGNILL